MFHKKDISRLKELFFVHLEYKQNILLYSKRKFRKETEHKHKTEKSINQKS